MVDTSAGTDADSLAWLAHGLVLPTRGLTVLQLGAGDVYWSALARLAAETTRQHRPAFVVQAGGATGYEAGAKYVAHAVAVGGLAAYFDDEDLEVDLPDRTGPGSTYSCCIPTLANMSASLREHERSFGPSLVILDKADVMRPYFPALIGEVPELQPMTPLEVGEWRARDLKAFAQSRVAPTVAVWDEGHGGCGDELEALVERASLHLFFENRNGVEVQVTARSRPSMLMPWEKRNLPSRAVLKYPNRP